MFQREVGQRLRQNIKSDLVEQDLSIYLLTIIKKHLLTIIKNIDTVLTVPRDQLNIFVEQRI